MNPPRHTSKSSPPDSPAIETRIGRGSKVESCHRAIAVAVPAGGPPLYFGEDHPDTFLRSVAKPFQTLTLFRAGIVDHHGLSDEELAVMTASHGGEPEHRRRVDGILRRGGFTASDLQCGVHSPFTASERRRMIAAGESPDALSNNCSGKHAGMLLHAARLGADPARYLEPDHPAQRAVEKVLELFLGAPFEPHDRAVDGCGTPTWCTSVERIAGAFARLSDREFLEDHGFDSAVDRLHAAIGSAPLLFSGEQRFPHLWHTYLAPELFSKEGAEGVFVVWGAPGVLAIKSLDGFERGYRYAVPAVLGHLGWLSRETVRRWGETDRPVVRNVAGRTVGEITVAIPPSQ